MENSPFNSCQVHQKAFIEGFGSKAFGSETGCKVVCGQLFYSVSEEEKDCKECQVINNVHSP